MHHKNIRALALALAAALCLLLVPTAAADYEPWTYEVDDLMGSYGVEYYSDVGFDAPTVGRNAASAGTQSTDGSTSGVSTYSAQGAQAVAVDGAAVYAEADAAEESYTVTIPSTVVIDAQSSTGSLEISGTVEPFYTLTIDVSSANDYQLKCTADSGYSIPYTVQLADGTNIAADNSQKQYTVETSAEAKTFQTELGLNVGSWPQELVSGEYTDRLTFMLDAQNRLKTYTVNIKKEGWGTARRSSADDHGYYTTTPLQVELESLSTVNWTTDDLVKLGVIEAGDEENWEPDSYTFTVPESNSAPIATLTVNRRLVWVDLNGVLRNADGTYDYTPTNLSHGTAEVWVNDVQAMAAGGTDYWAVWPCGSKLVCKISANTGYRVAGYALKEIWDEQESLVFLDSPVSEFTLTVDNIGYYETEKWTRRYNVNIIFEKVTAAANADTLLPSLDETKPVVIEMPTTDEDIADTTKDIDTVDDAADTPETTPDDLLITDADDMLASMDAAFAVPYPDEPA